MKYGFQIIHNKELNIIYVKNYEIMKCFLHISKASHHKHFNLSLVCQIHKKLINPLPYTSLRYTQEVLAQFMLFCLGFRMKHYSLLPDRLNQFENFEQ